jgi:hypothetical protein
MRNEIKIFRIITTLLRMFYFSVSSPLSLFIRFLSTSNPLVHFELAKRVILRTVAELEEKSWAGQAKKNVKKLF